MFHPYFLLSAHKKQNQAEPKARKEPTPEITLRLTRSHHPQLSHPKYFPNHFVCLHQLFKIILRSFLHIEVALFQYFIIVLILVHVHFLLKPVHSD